MSTRIHKSERKTQRNKLEARKQPVQRRSKATVEDILTAAIQVFEANGYASGTTNRIAERAGVSVGTLYQYFPNKEAVAVALIERHLTEGMQRVHQWVAHVVAERHTLREMMQFFVQNMLDLHGGRPRLNHILLEETTLPTRLHDMLLAGEKEAARSVAGLMRLYPESKHPHPEAAAVMVVQTVVNLTHWYTAHPDEGLPREQFAEELVTLLEAYLLSGSRPT